MNNLTQKFHEAVSKIVYKILENNNLLQSEWQLGKVDTVIDSKTLKCFINGGSVSMTVKCNPNVTFNPGEEIWVIFINNNPTNKFALCPRGI